MIYVTDLQRAMNWYRETLGFETLYAHPPHYAALKHSAMNFRLDLHPTNNAADIGHGPVPYFAAKDLDVEVARLRMLRVTVTDPRREGTSPRFCSFTDSEGNVMGLIEEQ
jgi:predicted enzyme related to lactoylglutathione lyase